MPSKTLQCIADTYISQASPNSNFGTLTTLQTSAIDLSYDYILMKFEPTGLDGRNITKISFYFYVTSVWTSRPVQEVILSVTLRRLSYPFQESVTTYNTRPDYYGSISQIYLDTITAGWRSQEASSGTSLEQFKSALAGDGIWISCGGYQNINIASRESANRPYVVVEYEASPPGKPTLIEPLSGSFDRSTPIRFAWNFIPGNTEAQKEFVLQFKLASGSTWEYVNQTTTNEYYDMPANLLPVGDVVWRVQTRNIFDELSPWSDEASISVYGAPAAPTITVSGGARPIVSWVSADRHAWELEIVRGSEVVYTAGEQEDGRIQSHTVQRYLSNGPYTARVRALSAYGYWSAWGTRAFTVSAITPGVPALLAQAFGDAIELTVNYTTPRCIIYRRRAGGEYRQIAELNGEMQWLDATAYSGVHYEYMARAIRTDNGFADSLAIDAVVMFRHISIAPVSDLTNRLRLKMRLSAQPARAWMMQADVTLHPVTGRTYPVSETTGRKTESVAVECFVGLELLNDLRALIDQGDVLYRSPDGRGIEGVVLGLSEVEAVKGFNVSFAVHRTRAEEVGELA